jgi:hypothetical protein
MHNYGTLDPKNPLNSDWQGPDTLTELEERILHFLDAYVTDLGEIPVLFLNDDIMNWGVFAYRRIVPDTVITPPDSEITQAFQLFQEHGLLRHRLDGGYAPTPLLLSRYNRLPGWEKGAILQAQQHFMRAADDSLIDLVANAQGDALKQAGQAAVFFHLCYKVLLEGPFTIEQIDEVLDQLAEQFHTSTRIPAEEG